MKSARRVVRIATSAPHLAHVSPSETAHRGAMAARKPVMLKPADLERMKSDKSPARAPRSSCTAQRRLRIRVVASRRRVLRPVRRAFCVARAPRAGVARRSACGAASVWQRARTLADVDRGAAAPSVAGLQAGGPRAGGAAAPKRRGQGGGNRAAAGATRRAPQRSSARAAPRPRVDAHALIRPQAERAARVRERVQKADAEEQRRLAVRTQPLCMRRTARRLQRAAVAHGWALTRVPQRRLTRRRRMCARRRAPRRLRAPTSGCGANRSR